MYPPYPAYRTLMSESEKKARRRMLQDGSTQRKMERETEFFWSIVEKNKKFNQRPTAIPEQVEVKELFGKQGSVGIKFDAYEAIPVECNGPGTEEFSPLTSFSDIKDRLPPFVVDNIARMKYDVPTPIQKYAIALGLTGNDLMCCAQTGSGKTCAFLIPLIAALDAHIRSMVKEESSWYETSVNENGVHPLGVILAPTRELASQIHLECRKLCFKSSLRALVLYGGSDIRQQLIELSYGCDIIVATPGRLIDIIDRGIINLSMVRCLILDEADRMLDMGFEPQIREVVTKRNMPPREERQTLMFSATFKSEIQKLASEFLREYVWIGVGRVGSTVENIEQVVKLASADLNVKLRLTLESIQETPGQTLVFVQKKRTASWLCEILRHQFKLRVDEIHSDKSQGQREASLRRFRDGQIRILVGTDVAARGLDIANVEHVIQFDLPFTPDEFDAYIHRMGRTGRAGHSGKATSLFVPGVVNGEGNGRVAALIMQLLEENEQEVPEWFKEVLENQQRMGKKGKKGGNKFGSRDVRVPQGQKQSLQYIQTNTAPPHGSHSFHHSSYGNQNASYAYSDPQQHAFGSGVSYDQHHVPLNMYPEPAHGYGMNTPSFALPPYGVANGCYPAAPELHMAHSSGSHSSLSSHPVASERDMGSCQQPSHLQSKRPPSLNVSHQPFVQGSSASTPVGYSMPVHFMPPTPSPGPYPPSPHFMMPPAASGGYHHSPRTHQQPAINSPSYAMRVDTTQMRVDAPAFVPHLPESGGDADNKK